MLFNMLINKDNVEAYLLDYLEGNLDAADEKALKAFAKAHPEYADLLNEEPLPKLTPDPNIIYADKAGLKREESGTRIFYLRPQVFRLAAAAAILALIVSIALPFFRGNETVDPTGIQANKDLPKITIDTNNITPKVDQSRPNKEQEQPEEEKDKTPAPVKRQIIPPSNLVAPPKEYVAEHRERAPDPLVAMQIDKLEVPRYTSDQLEMKHNLMAAAGPILPEDGELDSEKKQRKWYTGILNSEVARNFLPESIQETLPEQDKTAEKTKSQKNVILELPPAGKRIIDALFKSEE